MSLSPRRKVLLAVSLSVLVLALLAIGAALAAWRAHARMQPRIYQPSTRPIRALHVNERGDLITVVHGVHESPAGPVRVIRVADGTTVGVLEAEAGTERGIWTDVAPSGDGELLALSRGFKVEVWSARHARRVREHPLVPDHAAFAFASNGKLLLGRSPDGIGYRHTDIDNLTVAVPIDLRATIQPCGREYLLVRQSKWGAEELRDPATGAVVSSSWPANCRFAGGTSPARPVVAVFHPDAGRGGKTRTVFVVSCPDGRVIQTLDLAHEGWSIALSREADLVAVLTYDDEFKMFIELFSVATGKRIRTWSYRIREAWAVAFVPDADTLVVGTVEGRIELHPFRR